MDETFNYPAVALPLKERQVDFEDKKAAFDGPHASLSRGPYARRLGHQPDRRAATDIDFDAPVDLAAITTWTINSLRAYEIADNFRRRGVPVIMGGPQFTFTRRNLPRTAMRSASARGEHLARDARRFRERAPPEALQRPPFAGPCGLAHAAIRPARFLDIRE